MKSLNTMTSSEGAPLPKRVCLRKEELDILSKEELIEKWLLQDQYINSLKLKSGETENSELVSLRESEEKLKQQQLEATRKENILVMRLTTKEQEMQEYASQIQELKQSALPSLSQLRSALLDPAVNAMFERMRKEVETLKARLEETQNELSAWKFTPDSNTGKRLMAKCRLLYVENEELGKLISSGRTAKLEGDLALQKNFSEEMKKSQAELDDFLLELDEDVEGMQSTIYLLQQQLKEAKDQVVKLQAEKVQHQQQQPEQPTVTTLPCTSVAFSHNGLQHHAKQPEGPPSPGSPSLPQVPPVPASAPVSAPPVTIPQPQVHLPQKETSPTSSRPSIIVKERYLNGDEPEKSPGTPVHEMFDEPLQVEVRTEDENLNQNHRQQRSPERTPAPTSLSDHVRETSSPAPSPPKEPSVTNGKCSVVPSKTTSSEVSNPVPSDESSMELDVTSTSSPPNPPPTTTSSILVSDSGNDSGNIIIVQNNEVQEEAVNLTISSREMTPPSTITSVCTEGQIRQVAKESDGSSPRNFETEQFEPPSRVDIDDDTEVQVAQTLACWAASAKNSEAHQVSSRYLSNGEVEDTSSVSEGDL